MWHTRHTSDRFWMHCKKLLYSISSTQKMIASFLNESIILMVVLWPEATLFSMCLLGAFSKWCNLPAHIQKQMAIWSSLFVVATVAVSAPQLPRLAKHEQCFASAWLTKHWVRMVSAVSPRRSSRDANLPCFWQSLNWTDNLWETVAETLFTRKIGEAQTRTIVSQHVECGGAWTILDLF